MAVGTPEYKLRKLIYKACLPANKHCKWTQAKKVSLGKRLPLNEVTFIFFLLSGIKRLPSDTSLFYFSSLSLTFYKCWQASEKFQRKYLSSNLIKRVEIVLVLFLILWPSYVVMCSSPNFFEDLSHLYQDV